MKQELGRVIVGQDQVVDQTLMAIFCRGHALLVGVPGLAKTLLVATLARALELSFKRIQFAPDLMPADITGTDVLEANPETGHRGFRFVHGPIFANLVLADEINCTPPKTQAALLEAMQEHHVTVGEHTLDLPKPFFVLATQNPIEQEGGEAYVRLFWTAPGKKRQIIPSAAFLPARSAAAVVRWEVLVEGAI